MTKNTKEHILEIAFLLFLQKSFKAVTIKEIVEETGVSKGAFYHYFDSKKQLFEAVTKHFYLDVFVQDFDSYSKTSLNSFYHDVLADARKTFLSLKKVSNKKMQFDINNYQLIFEAVKLLPEFNRAMKAHNIKELDCWKNVVGSAQENGEIRSDIAKESIAATFIHIADGFGMERILIGSHKNSEKSLKGLQKLYDDYYRILKKEQK